MDNKTPAELLPEFYKEYNLGMDGGKNSSSVRIEMTKKFVLYFPNFSARKKAVLKHDIHHLVTDYPSTFTGETEISAWEIASGCKKYWAAWVLDMSGMMTGIIFNFWGVLKAFARGRRTRNLYYDVISTEEALNMKLSELRKILWLDKYPKNTKPDFVDFILFIPLIMVGTIYSILSLILLPFVIIYSIYIIARPHLQH
jgi:hypothetical protein